MLGTKNNRTTMPLNTLMNALTMKNRGGGSFIGANSERLLGKRTPGILVRVRVLK